jgi:hypothetical protein
MKITTCFRKRQQGAVAIIVGLSLFILIGLLGLVLDLGHLYITKTELQNAADAAALSGAKQLNGKTSGIDAAVSEAIRTAGQNQFDFTHQVVIGIGDIEAGTCPDDSCMSPASSITSDTLAANITFLKVTIPSGNLATWFMRAIPHGSQSTATFGLAVAGKYAVDITPIAICQLPDPGTTNELGYERGVSYKVADINPVANGVMYWIDPESAVPTVCPAANASDSLPYMCTGKTAFTPIVGQTVNTNSGISDNQLEALDSRFDVFNSTNKCEPTTAPPDTNVKEYVFDSNTPGSPKDWMNPDPAQQSISCIIDKNKCTGVPVPYASRSFSDYGVLWSAYRPTGKMVSDWPTYYKGDATNYPVPPTSISSPYAQTSGDFFKAPSNPGKPGRRVLNMVIVKCKADSGNCRTTTVLGIGKFFMQKKANQPSNKEIYVEFGGLLPTPLPTSDIKLYR